ncbi:MAG: hypothetical protein DI586_08930 [Micavibrio aeruginosavorus]|uniref:GIY-YIG domain-containing protein n=1 Tax=Micavibrio aeruginosavorus TaxID=349221 RepID=A0A2W5HLU8_9BACT|nr:MAG: hypothetical protein DI586_08930 [Micavibrio aeruginosavorus]
MERKFYTYILANKKNGTLYIGVTNNLMRRAYEHKEEVNNGFTEKYKIKILVYYEVYDDIENAIHREKRLKKYTRDAKIKLIEKDNLEWKDLYEQLNA